MYNKWKLNILLPSKIQTSVSVFQSNKKDTRNFYVKNTFKALLRLLSSTRTFACQIANTKLPKKIYQVEWCCTISQLFFVVKRSHKTHFSSPRIIIICLMCIGKMCNADILFLLFRNYLSFTFRYQRQYIP